MLLIPAIDIKDGRCVRLRQGRLDDVTLYDADPVTAAQRWVAAGARRLHVVDLDGAFSAHPVNLDAVARIVAANPDTPVQVGGGVRDLETIERYLELGVRYLIIGSRAAADPGFVIDACTRHPDRIIVGIDARDGRVAVDGWAKTASLEALALARRFDDCGVHAIVYTDIGRDGMMSGVNVDATAALARAVNTPIIASGGISSLADVERVARVAGDGVIGAITGRAIYEGALDLAEGQALADRIAVVGA